LAKKREAISFCPKKCEKGVLFFLDKTPFLSSFLHFFKKKRVVSQKDSSNKRIPWRNKKFGKNRLKKNRVLGRGGKGPPPKKKIVD
jgi:hypothetical protein